MVAVWRGRWRAVDREHSTWVASYEDGWAWSVPTSRETRCFTVMVDPGTGAAAGIVTRHLP
jgi:hypothetical protein